MSVSVRTVNTLGCGIELTERITCRVAELTGGIELLRKQLAGAEHELQRLEIAGQVITQLTAGGTPAGEPGGAGPAQRGFGLLVPPSSQASGTGDLPGDYRSLLEAVSAAAAETGGPVTCVMAAQRAGLDVTGRHSENIRAKLKRPGDRGWRILTRLRTDPANATILLRALLVFTRQHTTADRRS